MKMDGGTGREYTMEIRGEGRGKEDAEEWKDNAMLLRRVARRKRRDARYRG